MDNVQFSGHLENTLRKLGYITDALQNEYNVNERIIAFNPDVIVSRGTSSRLSTLNVGKRLRDNAKFVGKVILVFPPESVPDKAQMNNIKADAILLEPASALKIAMTVLKLESIEKTGMRDKLYKMAQEDSVFRAEEQNYLIQHGTSLEQELRIVRANEATEDMDKIRLKIQAELQGEQLTKLSSKIEAYNQQIDNIDTDLKKGLSKRDTKEKNKENRKDWGIPGSPESQELDAARKEFTIELFKKKPN
jgi:DNA-binding response OmpR family regulator